MKRSSQFWYATPVSRLPRAIIARATPRLWTTIPHLYFMDPIGGRDREGPPHGARVFAVDVSQHIAAKRRMI